MSMRAYLKSAIIAGALMAFGAGTATAQSCTETQFTSKTGQIYLEAETAAITNKDFATALRKINQLRGSTLNCYEEGAVLKLGAFIKLENGDRRGAAQDLLSALNKGYIPAKDRSQTFFNLAQIYLQENDHTQALNYMGQWINSGARPDRTQKWQLAVLNQKAGKLNEAIKWAEEVKRDDGSNFKQEVYDFLIFLYNKTGQKAKLSALVEDLLVREPTNRKYWDIISGGYFQDNQERKAFEVQKAMYLGGILKQEDELLRIVNFYNRFNAPYHGARVLEKEMNAGRISGSLKNLELLANLYQVAREHEKAIPVIQKAAAAGGGGAMYERLGRSYADLQNWSKAEDAMKQAINAGGLKDKGTAWVLIGQSRYEREDRAGAREAFRTAGNRAGRSWLEFMDAEVATAAALVCFEVTSEVLNLTNEDKVCDKIIVLGDAAPEACSTVKERLTVAEEKRANTAECRGS